MYIRILKIQKSFSSSVVEVSDFIFFIIKWAYLTRLNGPMILFCHTTGSIVKSRIKFIHLCKVYLRILVCDINEVLFLSATTTNSEMKPIGFFVKRSYKPLSRATEGVARWNTLSAYCHERNATSPSAGYVLI